LFWGGKGKDRVMPIKSFINARVEEALERRAIKDPKWIGLKELKVKADKKLIYQGLFYKSIWAKDRDLLFYELNLRTSCRLHLPFQKFESFFQNVRTFSSVELFKLKIKRSTWTSGLLTKKFYRLCHRLRLRKQYNYFWVNFDHF